MSTKHRERFADVGNGGELRFGELHTQYGENITCTCCERILTGHAIRMLELDQRIDAYHDFGGVPENKSQGWFPFGLKCAKRKISEAKIKMQVES